MLSLESFLVAHASNISVIDSSVFISVKCLVGLIVFFKMLVKIFSFAFRLRLGVGFLVGSINIFLSFIEGNVSLFSSVATIS